MTTPTGTLLPFERRVGERHPCRVHHGAGKTVLRCLFAQGDDLLARGFRLQQRVVDGSGQGGGARQGLGGESFYIKC